MSQKRDMGHPAFKCFDATDNRSQTWPVVPPEEHENGEQFQTVPTRTDGIGCVRVSQDSVTAEADSIWAILLRFAQGTLWFARESSQQILRLCSG